ncbi:MAG: hypothetical protein ACYDER_18320 [Ktedonobacteraceae bacterium]
MTMIALFSIGIDIRLFRRKGRHDLYGRTGMRNDADDHDSPFNDEEYEDDSMYHQPHNRHLKSILLAIAIICIGILLAWLVFIPVSELNIYPQIDSASPVASIQIERTPNLWSEYVVTGTYRDANGHEQHIKAQRLAGDKLIVEVDVIQFPGSGPRYQLIGVSGQYTSVLRQQSMPVGSVTNIQFNTNDNGYLNMIKNHPLLAPTVGITTCDITLGPIANHNSHSFTILVMNGTCNKQQLS